MATFTGIFHRLAGMLRPSDAIMRLNSAEGIAADQPSHSRAPSRRRLIEGDNLPLSILPEPALYIEPTNAPFERLKNLVDVSDGGVLAVTGERGAGKSMLLRKIADYYAHAQRPASTDTIENVVIHLASPVGTARDMDVFVMLFRHLAITVKERLLAKGSHASNDIEAIGREAVSTLRQRSIIVAYGLLVVLVVLTLWFAVPMMQRQKLEAMTAEYNSLQSTPVETSYEFREASADLTRLRTIANTAGKRVTETQIEAVRAAQARQDVVEKQASMRRQAMISRLKEAIDDKKKETPFSNDYFSIAASVMIGYPFIIWIYISFVRRRLRGLDLLEQGLLIFSERIERRLDYETTSGEERGFELNPLGWLKASGKRTNSDKARPLSLPELTSSYIDYVKQIRRVFRGKVIVCIDELDKITDLEQVKFILREIKGALYVKGSFYVLSISTDGLRSFEGRLADGRDIFESTFDDALSIRGLDVLSCRNILRARIEKTFTDAHDEQTGEIVTVIAVLSGGNTRELIRTFREWVLLEKQSGRPISATEVWQMFVMRRVQAMIDRLSSPNVSMVAADLKVLLEAIQANDQEIEQHLGYLETLGTNKPRATADALPVLDDDTAARLARYVIELRILILVKTSLIDLHHTCDEAATTGCADHLLSAYQKMPISVRSADEELQELGSRCRPERNAAGALERAKERLRAAFTDE